MLRVDIEPLWLLAHSESLRDNPEAYRAVIGTAYVTKTNFEDYASEGYPSGAPNLNESFFRSLHDGFVNYMEKQKYIPDIAYNIPSMAPAFVVAVFAEAVKTVAYIISWIFSWGGE